MKSSTSALISVAIANLLFVQCFAYILPQSAAKRAIEEPQEEFDDRQSSYRYYNDKTIEHFIKELPLVKEDLGEIYSGSVPISDEKPDRTLFFVFKPAINTTSNDLTICLDGGPGCSSLCTCICQI
jgi:carboxypeptidase D